MSLADQYERAGKLPPGVPRELALQAVKLAQTRRAGRLKCSVCGYLALTGPQANRIVNGQAFCFFHDPTRRGQ